MKRSRKLIKEAFLEGKMPTTSVALGFFDGLHRGHEAVIRRAVSHCEEGCSPAVFTFSMEDCLPGQKPAAKPDSAFQLVTNRQREELLADWGIEQLVCPPFSSIQSMEPEEFVETVLANFMNAQVVCCGKDFRFGRQAGAGTPELEALCARRGIRVDLVGEVTEGGRRISSTWIRELIRSGEVKSAAGLLGRPFGYDFTVVTGKQLGRKLNFPTLNQPFPETFVIPRYGVYASIAFVEGKWCPSVTNIGLRPTVEIQDQANSETFVMDFSGDLYGCAVSVRLLEFIRSEEKFGSVQDLRAQIGRDTETAAAIAQTYLQSPERNIGKNGGNG